MFMSNIDSVYKCTREKERQTGRPTGKKERKTDRTPGKKATHRFARPPFRSADAPLNRGDSLRSPSRSVAGFAPLTLRSSAAPSLLPRGCMCPFAEITSRDRLRFPLSVLTAKEHAGRGQPKIRAKSPARLLLAERC